MSRKEKIGSFLGFVLAVAVVPALGFAGLIWACFTDSPPYPSTMPDDHDLRHIDITSSNSRGDVDGYELDFAKPKVRARGASQDQPIRIEFPSVSSVGGRWVPHWTKASLIRPDGYAIDLHAKCDHEEDRFGADKVGAIARSPTPYMTGVLPPLDQFTGKWVKIEGEMGLSILQRIGSSKTFTPTSQTLRQVAQVFVVSSDEAAAISERQSHIFSRIVAGLFALLVVGLYMRIAWEVSDNLRHRICPIFEINATPDGQLHASSRHYPIGASGTTLADIRAQLKRTLGRWVWIRFDQSAHWVPRRRAIGKAKAVGDK